MKTILDTVFVLPLWGVFSTFLLVVTWLMALCALLNFIGFILGKVSRVSTALNFIVLLVVSFVSALLKLGGDTVIFDKWHLLASSSLSGGIFFWIRILVFVALLSPCINHVIRTCLRAFVISEVDQRLSSLPKANESRAATRLS